MKIPAERLSLVEHAPRQYAAMFRLQQSIELDQRLHDLISLRASQINGCAFCLDMHWKDARAAGESEERLYSLDAWRESLLCSDRERAALDLARGSSSSRSPRSTRGTGLNVATRLEPGHCKLGASAHPPP